MTESRPPLIIEGLAHGYDTEPVFEEVSLSLAAGELVAVLGASGSGKSTLLRAIAGFVTPRAGRISIAGEVVVEAGVERVPAERRGVGMVFQDYALFAHMSVYDNVAFGIPGARDAASRVSELLALVGLEGFEARRPSELSGGQQQRVALARALAPAPSLLLLDEPFANLDGPLRRDMGSELKRLLAARGVAALLVTHERTEALALAGRVAVFDGQGAGRAARVAQLDSPEAVYRRPASLGVASLTGRFSLVSAEARGREADCAFGRVALTCDFHGPCRLVARPEQLSFELGEGDCVLVQRRFCGAGYELEVESPQGRFCVELPGLLAPELGSRGRLVVTGPCAPVAAS